MAENETPPLTMSTQYLKDLSFENPHAPAVYAAMSKGTPDLNITVDVSPAKLQDRTFEIALKLGAEAKIEGNAAFLCEIEYAGIATVAESLPEEGIEALIMVEGPRYLFPFARAILATATRDGGFPPLVLNPIDFALLYENRRAARDGAAENGAEQKEAAEEGAA